MAKFVKTIGDDGSVFYINLDMILVVDEDTCEVTLVNGDVYSFDDELNDAEWRLVIGFVKRNMF